MLKRLKLLLLTIFGFIALSGALSAEGPFKIIVHSSNQTASMTKEQASKLFLKKVTKWENGNPVLPIDLNAASPVREIFSKEIHGKTVTAIKSYWQQKIFTGRDVPPPEKQSDSEVLAYVQANANAIGYVADASPTGTIKILKIID
jgi:ABC-type phosphate transport system substrate-binding protein